jgi:two-component system chemotaxis response regulator CheY
MKEVFNNKRILIVDDSLFIRDIVKKELKQMGFSGRKLKSVGDGSKALKLMYEEDFDLVISDWNMPVMDGLSLLKKIKTDAAFKDIFFVMLSAESQKENISEALALGADQFITKPFKSETFVLTIKNLLITPEVFADKTVMVVDDSPTTRKIIINNLQQAGFKKTNITEAPDGEAAINMLCGEKVDLIITDWHMPKMDGLEFIKRVRANDHLSDIPMLMVTAEADRSNVLSAVQAGVNNYITKPFNAIDLQGKVEKIFES